MLNSYLNLKYILKDEEEGIRIKNNNEDRIIFPLA